jgi:hypothetical protein
MAKPHRRSVKDLQRGDHACVIYSDSAELIAIVADYLAEGLRRGERCWYVAFDDETAAVRTALRDHGVSVDAEIRRGALKLLSATEAYLLRGGFDPEQTLKVFSDAIEEALTDGFTGFRAAAEMSWALDPRGGTDRLASYEALLKTLFSSCPATGLCLYHRGSMPLAVIGAALATHPVARVDGSFAINPLYDPRVTGLAGVDARKAAAQLKRFETHSE